MFRKCGLYLLSFAVLSTSLSVLFSGVSSAASAYDDHYHKITTAPIQKQNYYGTTCSAVDVSTDFASRILSGEYNGSTEQRNSMRTSFQNALDNGRWGVSVRQNFEGPNGWYTFAQVYWTENASLSLNWDIYPQGVVATGSGVKSASLGMILSDCNIYAYNFDTSAGIVSNGEKVDTTLPYNEVSTWRASNTLLNIDDANRNIPFGYEGESISNGTIKTKVLPDIDYEVVGKTIKFKYNGQNVPFTPCSANWMITKTNYQPDDFQSNTFLGTLEDAWDGWQDLTGASGANDSNNHVLDFRYKKSVSDQQTYTVDEYGNYYIALGLNTHWEGAPRLDCGDSGDSDNFNYDVKLKVVALKIDGTTYSGTTEGSECGAAGNFCDGFAGANGTNPILKAFQTLTNIQTFGLQAFLLAPINFVASLPSMANTCSPISFPLFGSSIQLQCLKPLYYSWSSTVMTIYTTLINAVVVYAVATKIFETIRNVSAPDKDRIEVVKL